jgi:hypothetical protein
VLSGGGGQLEVGEAAEGSAGREQGLDLDVREHEHFELTAGGPVREHVFPLHAQPPHWDRVVFGLDINLGPQSPER